MNDGGFVPTERRALLAGLGGLAAGGFLMAGRAEAGPLTPSGPPAPTPGPEPRIAINATNTPGNATYMHVITQPGSYYMTGNIVSSPGMGAIEVLANNVTVDMNGFACIGSGTTPFAISGPPNDEAGNIFNTIVRNGHISGYTGGGIGGEYTSSIIVENIQVRSTSSSGYGIFTRSNAVIVNCVVRGHSIGIAADAMGVVRSCSVQNSSIGYDLGSAMAMDCDATSCPTGFRLSRSRAMNCLAHGSQTAGFNLASRCSVVECDAVECATGILLDSINSEARNCRVSSCSVDGIRVGALGISCSVVDCTITHTVNAGVTNGMGLRVESGATNTIIDGNRGARNYFGVSVLATGCTIVRNVFGGSPSANAVVYNIVSGNRFGPLVKANISAGNTSVSAGSSTTGGTISTTDPMANLFW